MKQPSPAESTCTVTVAARRLGVSRRTVQADVAAGCSGIVRPGGPGRGRGALLNLAEYRAWRARRAGADPDPTRERERAWALLNEAALRIFQEHGGVTRQNRQRSAELLVRLLLRVQPALVADDAEPEQLRTLLHVLAESSQDNRRP